MSTHIFFFFLNLKIYQNHIIMGIIFFSLIAKITALVFNQAVFLYSICSVNFTCTLKLFSGSNSHIIFNNCLLGNCHQSDVSKLPQVISDHCKRINTE